MQNELQNKINMILYQKLDRIQKIIRGQKVFSHIQASIMATIKENGLENEIEVGRYHSWVISKENFPPDLEITSIDENGEIMSIRHKKFDVKGLQYHPESVLTPDGKKMLENWVNSTIHTL